MRIILTLFLLQLSLSISAQAASPTAACMRILFRENLNESEFGQRMIASLNSDFKALPTLAPEQSKALMKDWETTLAHFPIPQSERVTEASDALLAKLYDRVKDNRIGNAVNAPIYDPKGNLGFCFGRATTAHIEAMRLGMDKRQILKVWVSGTLETGKTRWGYHVATLVRGTKNRWMAIDPFFNAPLSLGDWLTNMASINPKGDLRTMITEAKRFGPSNASPYQLKHLKHSFYNHYFDDLLEDFRRESKLMSPSQLKAQP